MATGARKAASGRTRRDAVRADVLDAVERLLSGGESFTALGVQRICDEAGVARSAFYVNFDNKSDLLMQLVEAATESLFSLSVEWIDSDPPLERDELAATQANSIRVWREHAALMNAYAEVAAYDPEVAEFWRGRIETLIEAMALRLERSGGQLDARVTAEFIVRGVERITAEHVASRGPDEDEALAREIAAVIWALVEAR